MSRPIKTYEDLLKEKLHLEVLLQAQKELVMYDLGQLKQELKPAATAFNFLGKIVTRERNNLLVNEGANKLIDLVFKKLILSRSGWLTKLAVPYFLKNYSSHFIAEHKDQFMEKLVSLVSHKNGNGKAAPEASGEEY